MTTKRSPLSAIKIVFILILTVFAGLTLFLVQAQAYDNPHGDYLQNTDYCFTCHKTHTSEGQKLKKNPVESTVCFYCHDGNQSNSNIKERMEGKSQHNLDCTSCHNPHLNNRVQKVVLPYDTQTPYAGDLTVKESFNAYCYNCHDGVTTNGVTEGFNIKNGYDNVSSAHGFGYSSTWSPSMPMNAPYQNLEVRPVGCNDCHDSHGSSANLYNIKTVVNGKAVTMTASDGSDANNLCSSCHATKHSACLTCHEDRLDGTPENGGACFNCHKHNSVADFAGHDITKHSPSSDDKCQICHNASLDTEHTENRGKTCTACHAKTNPTYYNAVTWSQKNCGACHTTGHSQNLASPVPVDIPRYPGFQWSTPQDTAVWAGESWMPSEFFIAGWVILSNNRQDVAQQTVYEWYNDNLAAAGWTVGSTETGSGHFTTVFAKDKKRICVIFSGDGSTGYRLRIIYTTLN